MARIRKIEIRNFRSIRWLDWFPLAGTNYLRVRPTADFNVDDVPAVVLGWLAMTSFVGQIHVALGHAAGNIAVIRF